MKICAYCGRENEDAAVQCLFCGTDDFKSDAPGDRATLPVSAIRTQLEFVPLSPEESENDLVTFLRCRTLLEADLIVTQLESVGISAFIPDQFLMQAIAWNVNTYGFVRVQVPPQEYEAAKAFLLADPLLNAHRASKS
jgi:hypothetical protein